MEYQQGTLAGYEIREYLLEKWGRKCAYCRAKKKPLQIDHIRPKTHGGSDRVSNLALACETCNRKKGSLPVERFLARKPERLRRVLAQTKKPLRTAAAVNATRWALAKRLEETGLPVKLWSGGRTKWNRMRFGIPKEYCLDAACVGSLEGLHGWNKPVYCIRCMGRGRYRRTRSDSLGFPLAYFMRRKTVHGFQTGDLVRAVVPRGKNAGVVVGRVAVRAKGRFDIQTPAKVVQSISWKYCTVLARADGHSYHTERRMRLLSPRCKVSCADDNVRDSAAD